MEELKLTAKERVEIELKELDEKLTKLDSFVGTEMFKKLSEQQKRLLQIQACAMATYSNILVTRLELWED